jgi:hypothetical protein
MNRASMLLPALVLALAAPLAAADGVRIANKIPFAQPDTVREAIRKECDLENQMAQFLNEFGKGKIQLSDDIKGKGRVFDAKIAGVWAAGGPWGAASILVEGELREDGKVIGTVASRRNTTRGGGACSKLMVSGRKVAEDIAEWMQAPTMNARLGDAAK